MWRRPDKKEGYSATFGAVGENVFYVFSSNADPFEEMTAYSPFQVLTLLKFNGNFSECAKSLPKPEKNNYQPVVGKIDPSEIEKILLASRIDTSVEIEEPPTILSIKEKKDY